MYLFIAIIPRSAARLLQLHNNNNDDHIDLEFFFILKLMTTTLMLKMTTITATLNMTTIMVIIKMLTAATMKKNAMKVIKMKMPLLLLKLTMKSTRMQEKQRRICFLEDLGDGLERKTVKM